MLLPYLLAFCRIAIGITFACSFLAKVRDVGQFAQTITNFKLLPSRWSRPIALLFLTGELSVVALVFAGGQLLSVAFSLAILLLFTFTIALTFVLARNIQTLCNCFGTSERAVTYSDLWRNAGLVLVSGAGLWVSGVPGGINANLTFIELSFMAIIASVFVLIWANLGDFLMLFQSF